MPSPASRPAKEFSLPQRRAYTRAAGLPARCGSRQRLESPLTQRRSAGFTLIELMLVVTIIGILSALAGTAFQGMIRLGRVNGASNQLTAAINNARIRAVTQRCPHFVLITGRNYAPGGAPAGAPTRGPAIYVVQKGTCTPNGLLPPDGPFAMEYEPGILPVIPPATAPADRDRVVSTLRIDEALVDITSNQGTPGLAGALAVGFDPEGQMIYRDDPIGAGFRRFGPGPLQLTINSRDGRAAASVTVRVASGAAVVK